MTGKMNSKWQVRYLGLQPFESVWQQQRDFTDARTDKTQDEIWVLEHPDVFTLGQAGREEHLLNPGQIQVVKCDRGGQVTWHGPGQLVVYLLLDLRRAGINVKQLVSGIEAAVIELLAGYGIAACRRKGAPGVYVNRSYAKSVDAKSGNAESEHAHSIAAKSVDANGIDVSGIAAKSENVGSIAANGENVDSIDVSGIAANGENVDSIDVSGIAANGENVDSIAVSGIAANREIANGIVNPGAKIAALGLRIRRGCSYHGLSLNVDADLQHYERINPCGMAGLAVTSLQALGVPLPERQAALQEVADRLLPLLARQLGS